VGFSLHSLAQDAVVSLINLEGGGSKGDRFVGTGACTLISYGGPVD